MVSLVGLFGVGCHPLSKGRGRVSTPSYNPTSKGRNSCRERQTCDCLVHTNRLAVQTIDSIDFVNTERMWCCEYWTENE